MSERVVVMLDASEGRLLAKLVDEVARIRRELERLGMALERREEATKR